ncbi:serine/threonine-protein kinase [Haliangium sp.]|uniref:serine/threonine-protein kinase n=1 Tax=Haliangium sp. TaxID=2663208 RepID=UPI003D0B6AB0
MAHTGERIGEYKIRRLIGEGGMGKVYEAEERLSGRAVALKVLRPELGRSEQGRRLFLSEMNILAHLDHPNVVRCLACTEVEGDLVMVLELLAGETLRSRLGTEGRLPWTEAVAITLEVAAALEAAHSQDPAIVHRDLKPENLMLLTDGRVKVMDFGIAKVLASLRSNTTHSVGTLQYMSPEQIDAAPLDARSDLYSLGLVLYEMLAGAPPFESASPRELLELQCTAPPPALPDEVRAGLPRGVEQVLTQLLAKKPDDRPADAAAVREALSPFASAGAAFAPPAAPRSTATNPPAAAVTGDADADADADADDAKPATTAGGAAAASADTGGHAGKARSAAATVPGTRRATPGPRSGQIAAAAAGMGSDTIALIEQAGRSRQVPTATAIAIVLALCVLAGVATYVVSLGAGPL